jgi:two-component SAPR family response regulator
VSDVVAPAVAAAVLRRILEIRRVQLVNARNGALPGRLGETDQQLLASVVRQSKLHTFGADGSDITAVQLPSHVTDLLATVEDNVVLDTATQGKPPRDWSLMVRLVGEPVLEDRSGRRAVFGKKKSIELLAWMALNRDRSTRSAARTALWDVDVAGSTFSTIVSDMRRAMRVLSSDQLETDWSRATHTDVLPLSRRVVTDVEIIEGSLRSGSLSEIMSGLRLVRDMPFAGTAYLWADLDGSTTRIVMVVLKAVWRAIEIAAEVDDRDAAMSAISIGLRVLPGDSELLDMQAKLANIRVKPVFKPI